MEILKGGPCYPGATFLLTGKKQFPLAALVLCVSQGGDVNQFPMMHWKGHIC